MQEKKFIKVHEVTPQNNHIFIIFKVNGGYMKKLKIAILFEKSEHHTFFLFLELIQYLYSEHLI
jgi:hypothetical protein